jgi:hypothetical protein
MPGETGRVLARQKYIDAEESQLVLEAMKAAAVLLEASTAHATLNDSARRLAWDDPQKRRLDTELESHYDDRDESVDACCCGLTHAPEHSRRGETA